MVVNYVILNYTTSRTACQGDANKKGVKQMSAIYDNDTNSIYVSAGELCSFVYRGGDLSSRPLMGNKNGGTIVSHKSWNKKPNTVGAYSFNALVHGIGITVYTYPEWVRQEDGHYVIECVYSVPYFLDDIKNGALDLAITTAITTAYIIVEKYKLPSIEARVTFYKEGSDECREFVETLSREELVASFDHIMEQFYPFAKIIKEKSTCTLSQLKSLRFPFEGGARLGQRDFIVEVFRAIKSHKRLVVEAPTGTGKTMASLYPSLKCVGEGEADKIFYLTGKTTTALAALNAIDIMRGQIPDLRAIHISSKEKCCVTYPPRARRVCDPKHCHVTRGYFDKINMAILELLENYRTYTKEIIDTVSAKYSVCSYELSLELSEWCELVVCDYNYLFDLQAYLQRYFETVDARHVFLIDESHNLPDRAREMYSATLTKEQFVKIAEKYNGNKQLTGPCVDVFTPLPCLKSRSLGANCAAFISTTNCHPTFVTSLRHLCLAVKSFSPRITRMTSCTSYIWKPKNSCPFARFSTSALPCISRRWRKALRCAFCALTHHLCWTRV